MWLQRRLRRDAALRRLHEALSHSLINAKELFLFAGAYVLLWAVLGVLFLGGSASESPAAATSFSTLRAALYTSFALLTGANCWQRTMWAQMEAAGTPAVLFSLLQQLGAVFVMATLKGAFVRSFSVKEDTVRASRALHAQLHLTCRFRCCRSARTSSCLTALLTRTTLTSPSLLWCACVRCIT